MQPNLIQELILFVFKLNHKTAEAAQSICCLKSKGAFDYSTVIR